MNYDEILAAVGEGSAHPGGYIETVEFLEQLNIPPTSAILEVGCGTGKTACLLAQMGYRITAVDRNKNMIRKARLRASQLNLKVDFQLADMNSLPFTQEQFDIIIVESVTVFTNPDTSLYELIRVLKPGGCLYDREVFSLGNDSGLQSEFLHLYGAAVLPDYKQWIHYYEQAGFEKVTLRQTSTNNITPSKIADLSMEIDPLQIIDLNVIEDPSLNHFFIQNSNFLSKYNDSLSYGVFVCHKPW